MNLEREVKRGKSAKLYGRPCTMGPLRAARRPAAAAKRRTNEHENEMSDRSAPGRLRVIGGEWRGRRLRFPSRPGLRPTPDRVRETLFNWLAPILPGARCVDLFAGTGCLGLEALSRGAAEAWLVERDPVLARVLAGHVEMLGARAHVVRDDVRRFLARAAGPFDIAFVDPPYRDAIEPIVAALGPLLAPGAVVYVERPLPDGLPDAPPGREWSKRSRAGGIEFGLLRAAE